MDNAEAVARLTDSDYISDAKDGSSADRSSKIPLDAQSILDGAYSELIQSGKVEAGKGLKKNHGKTCHDGASCCCPFCARVICVGRNHATREQQQQQQQQRLSTFPYSRSNVRLQTYTTT